MLLNQARNIQMTFLYSDDDLLTDKQFTEYLQLAEGTPAVWRSENRYNLPYIKVGRSVCYRFGDVKVWLKSRERRNG